MQFRLHSFLLLVLSFVLVASAISIGAQDGPSLVKRELPSPNPHAPGHEKRKSILGSLFGGHKGSSKPKPKPKPEPEPEPEPKPEPKPTPPKNTPKDSPTPKPVVTSEKVEPTPTPKPVESSSPKPAESTSAKPSPTTTHATTPTVASTGGTSAPVSLSSSSVVSSSASSSASASSTTFSSSSALSTAESATSAGDFTSITSPSSATGFLTGSTSSLASGSDASLASASTSASIDDVTTDTSLIPSGQSTAVGSTGSVPSLSSSAPAPLSLTSSLTDSASNVASSASTSFLTTDPPSISSSASVTGSVTDSASSAATSSDTLTSGLMSTTATSTTNVTGTSTVFSSTTSGTATGTAIPKCNDKSCGGGVCALRHAPSNLTSIFSRGFASSINARRSSSLSRRAFIDPVTEWDQLVSQSGNTDVSDFDDRSSGWISFDGKTFKSVTIEGLIGCTVVAAVSDQGMMVEHLFESRWFDEETGDAELPEDSLYPGSNKKYISATLAAAQKKFASKKSALAGGRLVVMLPLNPRKRSTFRYETEPYNPYDEKTKKVDVHSEVMPPAGIVDDIKNMATSGTGISTPIVCTYSPVQRIPTNQKYRGKFAAQYDPTNSGSKVQVWCENNEQFH